VDLRRVLENLVESEERKMTPHPYASVIKAAADGATVQWRIVDPHWKDFDGTGFPDFSDLRMKWRVKPQTLRYRVAVLDEIHGKYLQTCYDEHVAQRCASVPHFIEWLHDWQEVEV
jgi:hypothetical protein